MSAGVALLLLVGLAVAALVGLQLAMAWRTKQQVGKPAPAVPGPLGDAVRGDALLFFHSPTCAPCKVMAPHIARLAAQDSRVHSVDVTGNMPLAQAFRVMATPTTITVKDGTVFDTRLGAVPADQLQAMLEAL